MAAEERAGRAVAQRQARYAEIAAEVHPSWCDGDPAGCEGYHTSKTVTLSASGGDGGLAVHVYANYDDGTGAGTVEVMVEFEAGPVSVEMTEAQARGLAEALTGRADLLAKPWSTWSWTVEQAEKYAEAVGA